MAHAAQQSDMTTYQFRIDDETWQEWKDTVPRSKSLEQRITELIEADKNGHVCDADQNAPDDNAE